MNVDVILGLQWGDEGKGKVVDVLTPNYDIVARFQGGPNAGHTLEFENQRKNIKKDAINRVSINFTHSSTAPLLLRAFPAILPVETLDSFS